MLPRRPGAPARDQCGHLGTARLSPDGVGRALTRCAKYAGLTGRRITGHSPRRGLVTTGIKKSKRIDKLRRQAGWSANKPGLLRVRSRGRDVRGRPDRGARSLTKASITGAAGGIPVSRPRFGCRVAISHTVVSATR